MCFIVKWRMCNPNLLDLTKGLKKYLLKHLIYYNIYILEWLITLKKLYRHSICITEAWLLLWKNNIIFRNSQDEKTKKYKLTVSLMEKLKKLNTHYSLLPLCERMDILIFVNSCYLVCEKINRCVLKILSDFYFKFEFYQKLGT